MNSEKLTELLKEYKMVRDAMEPLKLLEERLRLKIELEMRSSGRASIDAEGVNAKLGTRKRAVAKDWEGIRQYILQTGNIAVLQRRLSAAAVEELLEAGEKLPAKIEEDEVLTIRLEK